MAGRPGYGGRDIIGAIEKHGLDQRAAGGDTEIADAILSDERGRARDHGSGHARSAQVHIVGVLLGAAVHKGAPRRTD